MGMVGEANGGSFGGKVIAVETSGQFLYVGVWCLKIRTNLLVLNYYLLVLGSYRSDGVSFILQELKRRF